MTFAGIGQEMIDDMSKNEIRELYHSRHYDATISLF